MMMILLVISNPSRKCESQFESSQGLKTKKCLKPLSGLDVNIDSNSKCPPSFSSLKLPQNTLFPDKINSYCWLYSILNPQCFIRIPGPNILQHAPDDGLVPCSQWIRSKTNMIFRSQNVICKWCVLHGLVGFMEGDYPFCDPQINKWGALKKNTM